MTIRTARLGWAKARFGSKSIGSGLARWIIRHHAAVAMACFAFIFVVGLGLTRVHTNIDLLKLFDERCAVRADYAWLEQNIGRLVPLEVVIEFPRRQAARGEPRQWTPRKRLTRCPSGAAGARLADAADDRQELGPSGRNLVGPSLSPVTFAPPVPTGNRDSWAMARRQRDQRQAGRKRTGIGAKRLFARGPRNRNRIVADQPAGGRVCRSGLRRIRQQRAGRDRARVGRAAATRERARSRWLPDARMNRSVAQGLLVGTRRQRGCESPKTSTGGCNSRSIPRPCKICWARPG